MEPFEAVRQQAAQLHAAAVDAGADAWDPMSLAHHAAQVVGCKIETVPSGDPLLRGGRALYDPGLDLILHEKTDAGTAAFLIGHELGHAVVHKPSEIVVSDDVDPARPTQAAGGAADVVADYGRKSRREVQMDLFGRELVFPRQRARTLYVDDELSALEIVKRSGLPYELVAQQLLDAVLLPAAQDAGAGATKLVPVNDKQREAAIHRGSPFLLQAGPGTGKTRTLIERVEQLIDDPDVDPTTILVLTFSNKAAGELIERLTASRPNDAAAVWIGTFHAFGLDLIRRYHDQLELPDDPKLVDKAEAIGVMEELVPRLQLRHYRNLWDPTLILNDILAAISRAKDEVKDAQEYAALVDAMEQTAAESAEDFQVRCEKLAEIAELYAAYEAELKRLKKLDFGDLVMKPVRLLESRPDLAAEVRSRHQHVLIDEYQDVNRASVRLIKTLAGDGRKLWAVGDTRQSIYRFRGASSANLTAFDTDFATPKVDRLEINYRSSDEVVGAFSKFAASMQVSREAGILPLELEANMGKTGITPEFRLMALPADEPASIAHVILTLEKRGIKLRDQAVLCRGNGRLAKVAAALEARDIPILYLGNLFEREEVKDLLALMSLLSDPRASAVVRTATIERYAMPLSDVKLLLEHAASCRRPLEWLDGAEAVVVSDQAKQSMASLRADLAGQSIVSDPWHFLVDLLLDRSAVARELCRIGSSKSRMKAIALWQFLGFCRSSPKGAGPAMPALLERVRRMLLLSDERDLRQMPAAAADMDAVRLLTVHGSKGLEFDAVHIAGASTGSFPFTGGDPGCPVPDEMIFGADGLIGPEAVKQGREAEEECLFFVALSRAKRHLILYSPTQQEGGKTRNPSPFLAKIAGHYDIIPNSPLHQPSIALVEPLPLDGLEGPLSDQQLGAFDGCPRRFFYTHVLRVPGSRTATPFLKLHDAVYELMNWLRADCSRWELSREQIMAQFDEAWARKGPVGVGYEADYKAQGCGLIDALLNSRGGAKFAETMAIELQLDGATVTVTPDEIRMDGGQHVLRRVKTGKRSKSEFEKELAYGLYGVAAVEKFGPGARVEAIHLTDGSVEPLPLSPAQLKNRKTKAVTLSKRIFAGDFPIKRDDRKCPRCPHFFICDKVPGTGLD